MISLISKEKKQKQNTRKRTAKTSGTSSVFVTDLSVLWWEIRVHPWGIYGRQWKKHSSISLLWHKHHFFFSLGTGGSHGVTYIFRHFFHNELYYCHPGNYLTPKVAEFQPIYRWTSIVLGNYLLHWLGWLELKVIEPGKLEQSPNWLGTSWALLSLTPSTNGNSLCSIDTPGFIKLCPVLFVWLLLIFCAFTYFFKAAFKSFFEFGGHRSPPL